MKEDIELRKLAVELAIGSKDYNNEKLIEKAAAIEAFIKGGEEEKDNEVKSDDEYGIHPYRHTDGNTYVRVNVYNHDFLIPLHNLADDVNWEDADKVAKEHGMTLETPEQWHIIAAYRQQIDNELEAAGGEKFGNEWYWGAQHSGGYAWFYSGSSGTLSSIRKFSTNSVRPVLASVRAI